MSFDIQANELPAVRIAQAVGGKYDNDLLFVVGGGLGDRVCAEPTIRFALDTFKGKEISLLCDTPSLFRHLGFKMIYTKKEEVPENKYLPLYTYAQGGLANQFYNANLMHSVDFASLSALRGQLPIKYKDIKLEPTPPDASKPKEINRTLLNIAHSEGYILCHVGKSWESRTFPAPWWQSVMWEIKKRGYTPVLVGKDCIDMENVGNVGLDLRNKLSLNEFMWLLRHAVSIITNDSSPVHFGASGTARIAFVPTCRHPDLITHWRSGQWSWRQKPFFSKKMWEEFDNCPNHLEEMSIASIPKGSKMEEYLPNPQEIVDWSIKSP